MRSQRHLRRGIVAGAVVLVAAIVGAAAYDGWRLHEQIMAANERELGNLAQALATGTARSLEAVDVLLRDTTAWYEGGGRRAAAPEVRNALASRVVAVSQVSVLTIVDALGRQRYRSRDTGEPLADVSDRPYFQKHRDDPHAGLVINDPVITRTERLPALVMSRRLNRTDGSFDGVVTAIVTMQQLQSLYSAIELGQGSSLLLTLDDGSLVVRQPRVAAVELGLKFPELPALRGAPLVDRVVSRVDGRGKLVAALPVDGQRLIVAISRDEQEGLRPWYDEMVSASIRAAVFSLLVALTAVALLRQLRRLEVGAQALRESEERYAMAMEAANEGHAEWNVAADTVFASDKWRALHGMAPDIAIASSTDLRRLVVLHPDDAEQVRTAIEEHFASRTEAIELEYRVRPGDGDWHWIHARGRCVRDAAGAPVRLFCAATDVSARKQAQETQLVLEARLQQAQRLEALGTLAGGIAHDFNNILGAILGFGDMALQQAEAGSPLRRHLDRVMQAGARARLLIKRILEFSRSGVVEGLPVNLQGVVEEAVCMLAPSLPTGIELRVQLEAGTAAVIGNATQIHQVVMNLCTNAVQAMGEEGVLQVKLQRCAIGATPNLLHGVLTAGDYARLDVVDTGEGIPPEVLTRIFDPFFTTKQGGDGTGLGLSVVHGIVSDLRGGIDIRSTPNVGTSVSIWLPIAGDVEAMTASTAAEWPRGDGEVVMFVDDERPLVELGEELLAGLGYEPVGFDSSESALRVFRADPGRFDVVVTDEMLPGMPGSELARTVLSLRPDLPVVLMSGKINPALERRAREVGATALLHKPVALNELAECLARLVGKNRGEAAAP